MTVLYIVVPCYNEEEMLPISSVKFCEKLQELINAQKISAESRVLFVDDGSRDKTWEVIEDLHKGNKLCRGVKLSRNRGHQNALLAGLMFASEFCDCTISIDADLQDDINAMDGMIDKFHEGCEVVYGVRSLRATDTAFKRNSAQSFYKIINSMGGELVYDHADYRLLSKRALNSLAEYKETNLFLRGMVPKLGYKSAIVEYERGERVAGESKYPLKKMLKFAWEGITSLTMRPLDMLFGFGIFLCAFGLISAVVFTIFDEMTAVAAILSALAFFTGVNLLGLGVVGQYVGKNYIESKNRPRYHIDTTL